MLAILTDCQKWLTVNIDIIENDKNIPLVEFDQKQGVPITKCLTKKI